MPDVAAALVKARLLVTGTLKVRGLAAERCDWGPPLAALHSMGAASKAQLRGVVKQHLAAMTETMLADESAQVAQRAWRLLSERRSTTCGIYVHCAKLKEVNTLPLLSRALSEGKKCFVPQVQTTKSDLRMYHIDSLQELAPVPPFGILEPMKTYANGIERSEALAVDFPLDVLVVPGLAFDARGHRLGRGGGYYDKYILALKERYIEQQWQLPLIVALAYICQVVDDVPVGPNDQEVDVVVTANDTIVCTSSSNYG